MIAKHLKILGFKCEDKVTELQGVATSVCFDLYGCIQVLIRPKVDEDGKLNNCYWIDIARLKVIGEAPVMEVPNFEHGPVAEGLQGPEDKPVPA
ncbi:hypothetical protein [Aureliella helgolandensis]|uniref:Uncharacterized protein n=1 Tax=Aureliella helgolandensis TaxID=2527968 RepID=A0A518G747_9BACT|nr:hypothetical protein [Aureliella helgolandensis]QDV24414.1 hypothetical protein Q31a_27310 [Aureliella helgolandensis]